MAQPRLSDAAVSELLSVGPFHGIDASTSKYFTGQYNATDSIAVVPNRAFQGYVTAKGRTTAFGGNFSSLLYGFTKYLRAGLPTLYVGACNDNAGHGLLQQTALGGVPANLVLPTTLSPTAETSFVPYQNWLFETNGADTPLKIDANLAVTRWGLVAPTAGPTVAAGGAGNLFGSYQWLVTFGTPYQESSPSPVSGVLTLNNQQANLSAIPVSTDSQVTYRNIYRFGGTMQEIELVGTINNNTATTFTDNTGDLNITGQTLVTHRDPPQNFFAVEAHKGRVWGFGYNGQAVGEPASISGTSDLWFSNFEEPWGFDTSNGVIPVGRNTGGDIAVEVKSLGSILYCLKSRSFWAIPGNTPQDFYPIRLHDVGCISKKTVLVAYGRLFWLSQEGVQMFDGSSLVNISDNRQAGSTSSIKGILDGFSLTDFQKAAATATDQMYLLSFPTQNITFMYDIPSGEWWKLPWSFDRAVFDLENGNEVTAIRNGTAIGDSWFAAETDLGSAITSSYISRLTDSGAPQATKRYRYAVVLAPVQPGATATVTVTVDPGSTQKINTRSVDLSTSPAAHKVSLPPTLLGSEAQITVSVSSTKRTELHKVSLHGWIERQFVSKG